MPPLPPEKLGNLCTDYHCYVYFKNAYTKLGPTSKLDEAKIKVADPVAQVKYESGLEKYLICTLLPKSYIHFHSLIDLYM